MRGSGPLPPEGRRLTPADAGGLPKLVSPGRGQPALQTAPGAHHFRLLGLEFEPQDASAFVYDLVRLGDGSSAQDTLAEVPHHLVLDQVYVHGTAAGELKRGLALNSASTSIRPRWRPWASRISPAATTGSRPRASTGGAATDGKDPGVDFRELGRSPRPAAIP